MAEFTAEISRSLEAAIGGTKLSELRLHRSVVINIDGDSYRLRSHQATTTERRNRLASRTKPGAGNFHEQLWGISASGVTIVGVDSISDDRHHLSALRMAGAPLPSLKKVQAAVVGIPGTAAATLALVFRLAVALVLQTRRELAADLGSRIRLAAGSSAAWVVWAWASTSRLGQRLSDLSRRG